ncbi:type II 3-dehydroquinate dehydratase [Ramlibacter sp.]|uniref:type II 3-dehydroquinate dehydratase n=1 Tax=Ramlibacter sp. TaxID=1917967 RepID=UPI002FC6EC40
MKKILVLNGPNFNPPGSGEPARHGHATLADVEGLCRAAGARLGCEVECVQSNSEGVLIDKIHEYGRLFQAGKALGCVLNPGSLAHTSMALHDAIEGVDGLPVIECRISNAHAGEAVPQPSLISPVAAGIVAGFGVHCYVIALEGLVHTRSRGSARHP